MDMTTPDPPEPPATSATDEPPAASQSPEPPAILPTERPSDVPTVSPTALTTTLGARHVDSIRYAT